MSKMLTNNGAVVGKAPSTPEAVEEFLKLWVDPTLRGGADEGVKWLANVVGISYGDAIAALYVRNPRAYGQLAFRSFGNGYAQEAVNRSIDLFAVLQAAAQ